MDSDDGMNADSYVPSKLDKHITHNSSNLYDDEADDFNDDDYDGSANRKQATRFDTDLFGKLYEPESPDTPTNSNSSNKKHATSSSKPTPTTTIPMPTTTTTAIGIEPYVRFAKENGITRRSIATNYKNTGFELAYSRDIVPVTRKFDWAKEDFTIQNILPLKNNRSQLLAYLVWPNEIKTVHIIQELHDKCSKKLCRYYESRIKYT
ncbi:hypothetical protein BCR42DRAFT_230846 [Absidia repens]|uniref:Chromo shadow domain-containing protein n=1 Tax=Absidia repens TaxID=90262 RepID=A0A1X2IN28_9FUNG|nr:hypothetical protein BCR42DRAFT_230846 [Absidia repens]